MFIKRHYLWVLLIINYTVGQKSLPIEINSQFLLLYTSFLTFEGNNF